MTVTYEYRCDECGHASTVSAEVKERYGSLDGSRLDVDCLANATGGGECEGTPRRVWGANVATASVEGFYAHATHGKED